MKEELIVIENGRIRSKGNTVLKDLNLQINKNEILGIMFDSIVERKCLREFFKGDNPISDGKIYIRGKKTDYISASRYLRDNLTIIEKESKLISNLHIDENIFIFSEQNRLINRRKYIREFHKLMTGFNLIIDSNKTVAELTIKERVLVELIKAYAEKKKIVVLTHVTGFLKRNELEDIFPLLKKLQALGMTFIIVEQFENIIFEWTDHLALIRHGRTAAIFDSKDVNREQLYSLLMKDQKSRRTTDMNEIDLDEDKDSLPVLRFEDVCTSGLTNFNMEVEAGEVLKLYYMDDESCEQIIDLLKGLNKPLSGRISLANQDYKVNNIYQAVDRGVCFIEESPYENMLFYNMSVRDNLCMALSKKEPLIWFKKRYIKSVDQLIKSVNIEDIARVRLRRLEPRILQQIAYYKWYLYAPKVVVCIKPFTETDIHLQEITVEMITNLKSRGISVIILTSNFSELYRVEGDTIYIKNGHVIDEDEVYQTLYKE